jgi:crotonobetainyl-CoA:carnitine CoA-transferase CaiB-like acyl-CoA transferase
MMAARSSWTDPHAVRQAARAPAVAGLARAYPELYRELYQQALGQARLTLDARPAHQLASRQARIELKARLPEEYATRYQAELAAIQPVEVPAAKSVDRQRAAVARLRALVWMAGQYPDLARQRFQAEQARLPAAPMDRTPERCRALAWVRALDGLRAVYPEQFQARYLLELAGQVDQGPPP